MNAKSYLKGHGLFWTMNAVLAMLFTMLGSVSAQSSPVEIPGLFNTGVNDGGMLLPDGENDPHYKLVDPDGQPVNVRVENVTAPWLDQGPNSSWIVPDPEIMEQKFGIFSYKLAFDLSGCDPSTAAISGKWITDNNGEDILINGASTGNTKSGISTADFGVFGEFVIFGGFKEGVNELEFLVDNTESVTGLRVEMSGTCAPLDHLTCYRIKGASPRFARRNVILRDQFGEREVTIVRPETLCVPSSKQVLGDLGAPPWCPKFLDPLSCCLSNCARTSPPGTARDCIGICGVPTQ